MFFSQQCRLEGDECTGETDCLLGTEFSKESMVTTFVGNCPEMSYEIHILGENTEGVT